MGMAVITRIREMEPSDLEVVAALEAAHQPTPWSQEAFAEELAREGRVYLVAEDEDLVGFGGLMIVGEEAHVMNLLVERGRRGQGIGRMLLAALMERAVELGVRHVTLEVRSRNEAARKLYSRFGLAPVGVRKSYYRDDDALILWARDIDSTDYQRRLAELR